MNNSWYGPTKSYRDWHQRSRTRYVRPFPLDLPAPLTARYLPQELRLERLKLDVFFRPSNNPGQFRCLEPSDYKQLLQLLQRTKLQQLQLAALESIPDTPTDVEIRSVRLLRLSGPCTFKDSVAFVFLYSGLAPCADAYPPLANVPKPLQLTLGSRLPHSTASRRVLVLRRVVKCRRDVQVQSSIFQLPLSGTRRPAYPPSKLGCAHLHLSRTR